MSRIEGSIAATRPPARLSTSGPTCPLGSEGEMEARNTRPTDTAPRSIL